MKAKMVVFLVFFGLTSAFFNSSCTPPQEFIYEGEIIFLSNRDGEYFDIFSVAWGEEPINLTNTPDAEEFDASWNIYGDQILYVSNPMSDPEDTDDSDMQLIVMYHDDASKLVLDEGAPILMPRYTPDGSRIIYLRGTPPNREVFQIIIENRGYSSIDYSEPLKLCSPIPELNNLRSRFVLDPFYAPESPFLRDVYFDTSNPDQIYIMRLPEIDESQKFDDECKPMSILPVYPEVSEAGYGPEITVDRDGTTSRDKHLVFVDEISYQEQGVNGIGVRNLNFNEGFDLAVLEDTTPFPHMLSASNDYSMIAFWSDHSPDGPGPMKIYSFENDGVTTMRSTLSVSSFEEGPYTQRWSPNSTMLVFAGRNNHESDYSPKEIYVLNVSLDQKLDISNDLTAIDIQPRWQPAVE